MTHARAYPLSLPLCLRTSPALGERMRVMELLCRVAG